MNHHARLVLFLRAQNVITQLEAEEYLNPSALGGAGGTGSAAPGNMQARHAVRAGMVAHAVTFGVLALMLGLIHVAPLGATPKTTVVVNQTVGRGFIRLHAYPWAKITIDGKPSGETPMDKPVELADGPHTVKFEHPFYVPVERSITVDGATPDTAPVVQVDFPKEKVTMLAGKTVPPPLSDIAPGPSDPPAEKENK
jgi:hypothetical protein